MRIPTSPDRALVMDGKSAADLNKFLHTVGDQKLIAKTNDHGETVLFVKPKASSLGARISGHAKDRKQLAKTAIEQILTGVETKINAKAGTPQVARMFQELRTSVTANNGHSLVTGDIKAMVKALQSFEQNEAKFQNALGKAEPKIPKVAAMAKMLNAEAPNAAAIKFEEVVDPALIGQAGNNGATIEGESGKVTLPTITIGEKTFEPKKHLTEGGFASIYLYENVANRNEKVVLKTDQSFGTGATSDPDKRAAFEREAIVHAQNGAGANRHGNVLDLHGIVRLNDGSVGMLLEFAPGGTLADFGKALKAVEGDGASQVPRRLADAMRSKLMSDATQGLSHLADRDIAHRDMKGENVLLNSTGKPKVMDFGESVKAPEGTQSLASEFRNKNPFNTSPEIAGVRTGLTDAIGRSNILTSLDRVVDDLKLTTINPRDLKKELKTSLMTGYDTESVNAIAARPISGMANDNWSIGSMFAQLITGEEILTGNYKDNKENPLVERHVAGRNDGAALQNLVDGKVPEGAIMAPTGNAAFDALLETQFSRNPDDRLGPADLQRQAAMRQPGSSSPEVAAFIEQQTAVSTAFHDLQEAQADLKDYTNAIEKKYLNKDGGPTADEQNTLSNHRIAVFEANNKFQTALQNPEYQAAKQQAIDAIDREIEAQRNGAPDQPGNVGMQLGGVINAAALQNEIIVK